MLTALFAVLTFSVTTLPIPVIPWQELQKGDQIGSGSFGDVYRGKWKRQEVAIKELRMKTLSADLRQDFNAETQFMWQCQFPNVLRLLGVCTEAGHYAMVFDLMSHGSLYDLLHSQTEIPERRRWQIATGIAQGLADLHSTGVLHRDLKSHNILLDDHNRAHISDFGLAKLRLATSTTTTHAAPVGTMRWRAPELLLTAKPPKPNPAIDMYSYGMILWELVTRAIPFEGQPDDFAVMHAVKNGEREEIPADCHPIWKEIIEACWQKDPERRPTAVQILERLKGAQPKPPRSVWLPEEDYGSAIPASGFVLFPATLQDWRKVLDYYRHHAVPGYDVGRIDVIYNPTMNERFASTMRLLQQRRGNPRYAANWSQEANAALRAALYKQLETLAEPYQDDDNPDVKLMPVWHGTQRDKLKSILSAGYTPFCDTDHGYFGEGVYAAHEASYAQPYATKFGQISLDDSILILNWLSAYSSYPIISQDYNPSTQNLVSSIEPGRYDSRFIPVVRPPDGSYSYVPVPPGQRHECTEVMVLNPAQILPRYLITLQRSLPPVMPSALNSQTMAAFNALAARIVQQEELARRQLKDVMSTEYREGLDRLADIEKSEKTALELRLAQEQSQRSRAVALQAGPPSPVVQGMVIPVVARGHEEFYRRFYNGRLIYKKGQPDEVVLPFSCLSNPLGGTFDLSRCGDTGKYLSIATGYKQSKNPANANKVEVWFAPRFLIEREVGSTAQQFQPIMAGWQANCPLALLWTWGGHDCANNNYDYLTNETIDDIMSKNLYECHAGGRGWLSDRWDIVCHGMRAVTLQCFHVN